MAQDKRPDRVLVLQNQHPPLVHVVVLDHLQVHAADQDLAAVLLKPRPNQDHVPEVAHNIHDLHRNNLDLVPDRVLENHVRPANQNRDPVPDLVQQDRRQAQENPVHDQDPVRTGHNRGNQDRGRDLVHENPDHVQSPYHHNDLDLVRGNRHQDRVQDHVLDQDRELQDHVPDQNQENQGHDLDRDRENLGHVQDLVL